MYIYFIQAFGERGLQRIKIGWSNDPDARLRDLQTGSPVKLRLIGKVKCKSEADAKSVERLAHSLFEKQRRRGEWLRLSKAQINMLKSLAAKGEKNAA